MALTPQDVAELHDSIKKLLGLWMRTKLVFVKAFAEAETTRDQENAFLQLKSEVSRIYRTVSDKLPAGLKFDGEKMMEMLKNAMTMDHLSKQPPAERQACYRLWHQIYIRLTRTLGALEVMKSGYYPHPHRARLKKRADLEAKAAKT